MSMGNMWAETPEAGAQKGADREMSDIPDGSYEGKIVDWSCFRAKSGDWYVSWWIELDQGLHSGALLQRFGDLNERSVPWTKADLRLVLGRVPNWQEMANEETGQTGRVRGEVLGARVAVRQRSRSYQGTVYKDVYLNELLNRPEPSQELSEEDVIPEARWEKERAEATAEASPTSPTTQPPPPDVEDGWGDPDCPACHGKGCDSCIAF